MKMAITRTKHTSDMKISARCRRISNRDAMGREMGRFGSAGTASWSCKFGFRGERNIGNRHLDLSGGGSGWKRITVMAKGLVVVELLVGAAPSALVFGLFPQTSQVSLCPRGLLNLVRAYCWVGDR
ncbi:hypothetical protein LX32DRAFT_425630 [Colletotrichum zoysiae]|uniref:Uncharacterized protein n=1 Tax=Colletotrichum zoysiae TaxID=1216348 RepID=A0AAD9HFD5_9PEZI|nr:hypothetical protein LX32DRAFT_425630 [Colletotrichum zoysiae]